ncbi:MAG: co-chaperone YbbN [Burkholderiales bacterium]|nr:co-chaperone YbbN [Burkholderiales bacterium]MCJ7838635.1 co-chaperone YbbN [Burkholderiales bacterium]
MNTHTFETGTETFERDVLQASASVPVLVDFWAPWCAPCRALKPILEKLAGEYKGRFVLAKVNSDEHPQLSARFGVRGIPNVKAFVDGKLADEFTGALPESEVRAFIDRLIPTPGEKLRRTARALVNQGDFDEAERNLRSALELEPENLAVRLDLVELLLAKNSHAEADQLFAPIPERERDERADRLYSVLALWKKSREMPPIDELEAKLAADPDDLNSRLALGERLVADMRFEPALAALLEVVRKDRGALRTSARKLMVDVFSLAEDQDELVSKFRKLLAGALY